MPRARARVLVLPVGGVEKRGDVQRAVGVNDDAVRARCGQVAAEVAQGLY